MRLSISLLLCRLSAHLHRGLQEIPPATVAGDGADWTMYGRTNDEQRFSPLSQINEQNIGRLGLVWSKELGTTRGLEATPLVSNGVIYTTAEWSVAYALDAKSGKILWTFDPKVNRAHARTICCDVVNRGVALYHGKVYLGTLDGRLIALDAKSGNPVWEVVTADQSNPYAITGAPRIVKGMVLIGNAGSEFGVRGYLSAYDAESGKLVWRTYTVPGDPALGFESKALESAAKTWHGKWWVAGGGGTPWDSIVYDPELDLIYAGTGNGTRGTAICAARAEATICISPPYWRCAQARGVGLALPGNPGGKLGLRRYAAFNARRSEDRRHSAQGHHAGVEERIFLRARSPDRPVPFCETVCQGCYLGQRNRSQERTADRIANRV
jgi:hypothetical protein